MPTFDYRAQDANGRTCRGQQHADSARHARQRLRERGLRPLQVSEASVGRTAGPPALTGEEPGLKDVAGSLQHMVSFETVPPV